MVEKLTHEGRIALIDDLVKQATSQNQRKAEELLGVVAATVFIDIGRIADALETIAKNTGRVEITNTRITPSHE